MSDRPDRKVISATRDDCERWDQYTADGWWRGRTLDDVFRKVVADHEDKAALIDSVRQLTFGELDGNVQRLAESLAARGVEPGAAVAFQLPNWWEAVVVYLAAARMGCTALPLHLIYRQHELRFVLAQARPSVVFVPSEFRGVPYAANLAEVCAELADGPLTITVRGPDDQFAPLVESTLPIVGRAWEQDASRILLLMYTSGTTSDPKGVLHSHNTLQRASDDLAALFGIGSSDVALVPSPLTHVAGMLRAQVTLCAGGTSVLMERWDPDEALALVLEHGCTYTGGAVPFVAGLVEAARRNNIPREQIPLRCGPVGGTEVPRTIVGECEVVLGVRFSRIYGLTEGVTATGTGPDDDEWSRYRTDGRRLPGMEVRILDASDHDVSPGGVGEIVLRGPANFLGYLDARLNDDAFLPESWMRTGDLGRFDGDLLTVEGRKKDIIIRGGENISVREVEDLLSDHPDVKDVAIVAMPSPDLGEKACAYVVPEPGGEPTLDALVEFLRAKQIAPQKLPEHLVLMPGGLPVNATGKVQRYLLREDIRDRLASA